MSKEFQIWLLIAFILACVFAYFMPKEMPK